MVHSSQLARCAVSVAVTLSLSAAFVAAPAALSVGPFDDAAYAKGNGKGGDNGRGGGRDKADRDRGGDRDKGGRGNAGKNGKSAKKGNSNGGGGRSAKSTGNPLKDFKRDVGGLFGKKDRKIVKVQRPAPQKSKGSKMRDVAVATTAGSTVAHGKMKSGSVDEYGLHASDRKALNAKVARPAIENKIRNQNFNGISGQYAKMDLMTRAAEAYESGDYSSLSYEDIRALDHLGFDPEDTVLTKWETEGADQLDDTHPSDIQYDVMVNEDGTLSVTCGNCEPDGTVVDAGGDVIYEADEVDGFIADAESDLNMQKSDEDMVAEDARDTLDELYDHAEDGLLARSSYSGEEETGYAYLEGVNDHLNGSRDVTERSQEFSDYANPDWPDPVDQAEGGEIDPESTVLAEGEIVSQEF